MAKTSISVMTHFIIIEYEDLNSMASMNSKIHTLEDNYNTVFEKLKELEAQIRTLLVEQNKIKCDTDADKGKYPYDLKVCLHVISI